MESFIILGYYKIIIQKVIYILGSQMINSTAMAWTAYLTSSFASVHVRTENPTPMHTHWLHQTSKSLSFIISGWSLLLYWKIRIVWADFVHHACARNSSPNCKESSKLAYSLVLKIFQQDRMQKYSEFSEWLGP